MSKKKTIRKLRKRIRYLQLDVAVAGTDTEVYWKGSDTACHGVGHLWWNALTGPIQPAGKLNLEILQRCREKTAELRTRLQTLEANFDSKVPHKLPPHPPSPRP